MAGWAPGCCWPRTIGRSGRPSPAPSSWRVTRSRPLTDGAAALDAIWPSEPDVVILDWMMPGVDGLSVCRRLRRPAARRPDPHADGADRDRGPGLGARRRRRRLPAQAVLPRRAPGPGAGAAPPVRQRRRATAPCRVADLVVDPAARRALAGRARARADQDRVRPARSRWSATPASSAPTPRSTTRSWGYDFGPDSKTLAVYVGYLRRKLEEGGEPTAHPHRAGRRLHAAGAVTLRARLALALGLLTAVAVTAMALVGYRTTADPPLPARSTAR